MMGEKQTNDGWALQKFMTPDLKWSFISAQHFSYIALLNLLTLLEEYFVFLYVSL